MRLAQKSSQIVLGGMRCLHLLFTEDTEREKVSNLHKVTQQVWDGTGMGTQFGSRVHAVLPTKFMSNK